MKKFLVLFSAVLAFTLAALPAAAQVTPRNVIELELSTSTATNNTTTAITSQAFTIKPDSGFAIVVSFKLAGSGTENITFNFAVSLDGTTWTTTRPFTYQVAANGTTDVIGFKNFGPTDGANNILYVRLASVTNGSSGQACTINSITVTKNN
jgi:pyridoxal/pyridoxine/pyridoxamine kinase